MKNSLSVSLLLLIIGIVAFLPRNTTAQTFRELWSKTDYSWFDSESYGTERSIAYHDGKLYVASRGNGDRIRIIDASDGSDIGNIDASSLSGGTFDFNTVGVSDDGYIFASNLTTDASVDTFRVYVWKNDDDTSPVELIKRKTVTAGMRVGDHLVVIGSVSDSTACIYAPIDNGSLFRWVVGWDGEAYDVQQGGPVNDHFSLPDLGSWDARGSFVAPKGPGKGSGFIAGSRNLLRARSYNSNNEGTGFFDLPGSADGRGITALSYQQYNGNSYLFSYRVNSGSDVAEEDQRKVYLNQIGASGNSNTDRTGTVIASSDQLGDNTEDFIGDIAVVNVESGLFRVYVLVPGEGIWAMDIRIGDPLTLDDYEWSRSGSGAPGDRPDWFSETNLERSMTLVEEDGITKMLIQSAQSIVNNPENYTVYIVNAETGADIGTMDLSNYVSGGVFHLMDLATSEDNRIFMSNLTRDGLFGDDYGKFRVWMFESTTDTNPELVLEDTRPDGDDDWGLARTMTITGNYNAGTATIHIVSYQGNDKAIRYTQTGPGASFDVAGAEIFQLESVGSYSGPTASAARPGHAPFYQKGRGHPARKYDADGNLIGTISCNVIPGPSSSTSPVRIQFIGTCVEGTDYIAVNDIVESRIILVRVPNGDPALAEVVARTRSFGNEGNPIYGGDFRVVPTDEGFNVYALFTNNGISFSKIPGAVTFEEYGDMVVGGAERGWRMLSLPFTNVSIENLSEQYFVQGYGPGGELYPEREASILFFDPDKQQWSARERKKTYELASGEGFIWFFYNGEAGYANDHPLPVWLRHDGSTPSSNISGYSLGEGKNLIGNPFHQDLDLTGESGIDSWANNDGLSSAIVQVWDNDHPDSIYTVSQRTGDYSHTGFWRMIGDTGADGETIAPWQGFIVENNAETPATEISFPIAAAPSFRGRQTMFYKEDHSAAVQNWKRLDFFLIHHSSSSTQTLSDRSSMLFHPDATEEWDRYDATKFTPFAHSFASIAFEGEHRGEPVLKVQESRPLDFEGSFEVPLSFDIHNMSGPFTIEWAGINGLPEDWVVMLHDDHAGTSVDMKEEDSYTFAADDVEKYALTKAPGKGKMAIPALTSLELGGLSKSLPGDARFSIFVASDPVYGEILADLPEKVELSQNYPNPFNPVTVLPYALPEESHIRLTIYDVLGRQVAVLVDGVKEAGRYEVSWDATRQASGVYIYRLEAGGEAFTRKMTLMK